MGLDQLNAFMTKDAFLSTAKQTYIEDLTRVVISYQIYETSFSEFHKFNIK